MCRVLYWILPLLFFVSSCSDFYDVVDLKSLNLSSSAEDVVDGKLVAGEYLLEGSTHRSEEFFRTGKKSLILDAENPYGFVLMLSDVKKGDSYIISMWMSLEAEPGTFIISGDGESGKFYKKNHIIIDEDNGWGLIKTVFIANEDYSELKMYALNKSSNPAYFDDLSIEGFLQHRLPPVTSPVKELRIELAPAELAQISLYRELALERGVITGDLKKYVNAFITDDEVRIPIKLRIKGDWVDHVESDKWSFRIKISGNYAYSGLKKFSIQNPSTRSFMMEWFAHKLFEREDVLTTKYEFVSVFVNGQQMGVYALEEHFDKQLLERNNRREGPIVKYDESGVWDQHLVETNEKQFYSLPTLMASEILPFKNKKTYKTPTLKEAFEIAVDHMDRYRNHDVNVDDYFDLESLAKFLALSDVLNGKHGLIWHNQRHYMNPITGKLEPIAFDCFTKLDEVSNSVDMLGVNWLLKKSHTLTEVLLFNSELNSLYLSYVNKYSSQDFLTSTISELEEEINTLETLLQYEYPFYEFNEDYFFSNAAQLRELLNSFKFEKVRVEVAEQSFSELPPNVLYEEIALNAYTQTSSELLLKNFHSSSLEVIGYSVKSNKDSVIYFPEALELSEFNSESSSASLLIESNPRYLHYRALNCGDRVFVEKISKWGRKHFTNIRETSLLALGVKSGEGDIVISKGVYEISSDIVIPKGRVVVFEAGVILNLINNASFITHSPVEMNGTAGMPILITSLDSTANGFVVIAPGEKSVLSHAHFEGLNTLHKNNRTLTGAVTIYEGEVLLESCTFKDNHCEDALNLIRCDFVMDNCKVYGTFSDGFDADFCTGLVINSEFYNTGNDCLDFSGSQITINSCTVRNSGDKGISCGENSHLTIVNCEIDSAFIAIAAKDLSSVVVEEVSISRCDYSFAVFQKKPEYGPATIVVDSLSTDTRSAKDPKKVNYLVDKNSILFYLGEEIVGEEHIDIDKLYLQ